MSDGGDSRPPPPAWPSPPPGAPPPPGAGTGWPAPPPPNAPPSGPFAAPQWGQGPPPVSAWTPSPWGATAPRRTNSLAVVSLVAGLAQFVMPLIAAIAAVITGHIARSQIRRTHEEGSGMALAGIILGYIGVAFTVLVVGGAIVFVAAFSDDVSQAALRHRGNGFARQIERQAVVNQMSPRDPALLQRAWLIELNDCCRDLAVYLPDGTPITQATGADYQRTGWQLEMKDDSFRTVYLCLTIPVVPGSQVIVRDGRCAGSLEGRASS